MKKLRAFLRNWLGIQNLEVKLDNLKVEFRQQFSVVGIDTGYFSDTLVIVASRLGGGKVHIIDAHFPDYPTLQRELGRLKEMYGPSDPVFDCTPHDGGWLVSEAWRES